MSLAADLAGYGDPGPEPESWDEPCPPPDDAEQAEWQLRKMATLAAKRAEVDHLAQAELNRVARWATETDEPLRREYEWRERAVESWALATNRDHPDRKTFRLPHGEVTVRAQRERVEATTDQGLLAAAVALDVNLFRSKWEADKKAIAKACEPGELEAVREGEEVRQALLRMTDGDGEVVRHPLPGVHVVVPTAPKVAVRLEVGE